TTAGICRTGTASRGTAVTRTRAAAVVGRAGTGGAAVAPAGRASATDRGTTSLRCTAVGRCTAGVGTDPRGAALCRCRTSRRTAGVGRAAAARRDHLLVPDLLDAGAGLLRLIAFREQRPQG